MPVVISTAESLPIQCDTDSNGTSAGQPQSTSSSASTTTTKPAVGATVTADIPPESSQQMILLPEPFYPIKSCLSSKSLFVDDDDVDNNGINATRSVPSSPKMKKSVSFHKIKIREHERTISDNPSVSSGIGLGIGWESIDSLQCSVDEWEIYRPPRRTKSNLIIPQYLRTQILRNECEITDKQINDSLKQIAAIKVSRNKASKDPVVESPNNHIPDDNTALSTMLLNATVTTPIPRRRSFMGLPRFLRPTKNYHGTNNNNGNNNSALVDMEVEQLMERSLRAEKIRQQQRRDVMNAMQQQKENEERLKEKMERDEENQPRPVESQLPTGTPSTEPFTGHEFNCKNDDPGCTTTTVITEQQHMESSVTDEQHLSCPPTRVMSSPSPFATASTTTTTATTADHYPKDSDELEDEAWEF